MDIKKTFSIVILSFLVLSLFTSCATPYQSGGMMGGYSESQLNNDTYKVSFTGNAYTSLNKVQNYLLYRCAQLTLGKGYKYFVILTENVDDTGSICQTELDKNTADSNEFDWVKVDNSSYYCDETNANHSLSGGDKYGDRVVMKMVESNKNFRAVFDAEALVRDIKM